MDEKTMLNRTDLVVAQLHLDLARHHRQLASDAMERVRKRRTGRPVDEDFDPFDEAQDESEVGVESHV